MDRDVLRVPGRGKVPGTREARPPCLLLSGGVDSALVARFLLDVGTPPTALFVDYGQPAACAEAAASAALAAHFGLIRDLLGSSPGCLSAWWPSRWTGPGRDPAEAVAGIWPC